MPGLFTVEESAARVGHYKWIEMRLFETLGGWVATVPELDVKMVLGPSMIRNENGLLSGYVFVDMAGRDVAYRGSLVMNIVEVCHLDVASFGREDKCRVAVAVARIHIGSLLKPGYRRLDVPLIGSRDQIVVLL